MKNHKLFLLIPVSLVLIMSFAPLKISKNNEILKMEQIKQDTLKWVAPASANKLINPYEADDENIAIGLRIYRKHCRSCHGRNGAGDGAEAADLSTTVTDLTVLSFLEQTDGSMFWKISEGRYDMESFVKKLDEEDIWLVVSYIKTLSAAPKE